MSTPTSADLRHMTSNPNVHAPVSKDKDHKSSNRHSQHLHASAIRVGSKSPSSIPSSPTSVHSSSSAIFERDIEPIPCPSPPHHSTNPHRIPRSKTTETIEQSVPSVLDSAATILAGLEDQEQIAVLAPATNLDMHGRSSGFASPIGSFRSRSPSPLGSRVPGSPGTRTSLLLSLPHSASHSPPGAGVSVMQATSPISPMILPQTAAGATPSGLTATRPTIQTQFSPAPTQQVPEADPNISGTPSIVTPTSAYYSTSSSVHSAESSPTTTTREHPVQALPVGQSPEQSHASPTHSPPNQSPSAHNAMLLSYPISPASFSHPPSPSHHATKRLSFMSYSDLLSSTPASTIPLSSLTTSASTADPPPHIPSVSGYTQAQSAAASLRGLMFGGNGQAMNVRDRDSIALLDDVGGEWEREGLGRGLEERLEELMPVSGKA